LEASLWKRPDEHEQALVESCGGEVAHGVHCGGLHVGDGGEGRGVKRASVRRKPRLPAHAWSFADVARARSCRLSPCTGHDDGEICSGTRTEDAPDVAGVPLAKVVEAAEKGLGVDETEEAAAWSGLDMVPTAEAVPSGLCAISTERIAPTRLGLSRNEPSWNRGLHFRSNRPTSSRSAPDQIEAEGGDSAARSRRWLEPAEGGWSKRRRRRW
jgi:hypothetical protein